MSRQPPTQELVAKDLHGIEWRFRHIFRGNGFFFFSKYIYFLPLLFVCALNQLDLNMRNATLWSKPVLSLPVHAYL